MQTNILVVDDEKEIADLVELYVKNEGYHITKASTGKEALRLIENKKIDLAILDVMLPDINGFDLCKTIRKQYTFPIIMLTAKVADMDKVIGLTIGADDYVTKPFNPIELVARVNSALRRYRNYNEVDVVENKNIIDFSGLVINKETHECTLYNKEIKFTPIEFDILWFLCVNAGKVISSEQLFEQIWKEKYMDSNNTVMVHIRRIREKMNEPSKNPKFIKTIWGVGYKIEK